MSQRGFTNVLIRLILDRGEMVKENVHYTGLLKRSSQGHTMKKMAHFTLCLLPPIKSLGFDFIHKKGEFIGHPLCKGRKPKAVSEDGTKFQGLSSTRGVHFSIFPVSLVEVSIVQPQSTCCASSRPEALPLIPSLPVSLCVFQTPVKTAAEPVVFPSLAAQGRWGFFYVCGRSNCWLHWATLNRSRISPRRLLWDDPTVELRSAAAS